MRLTILNEYCGKYGAMLDGFIRSCKEKGATVTGKNQGAVRSFEAPDGDVLFSFCIGQIGSELREYIEKARSSGQVVFIGELGYFDRGAYFGITKLGETGVHNREEKWLMEAKNPSDRLKKHGVKVSVHKNKTSKKALLLGQVNGDTQLDGIDICSWYEEKTAQAEAAGYEVKFRPHPRVATPSESLHEAMKECGLVMAYNSTGLVDAIIDGVPFYCSNKSQYYPLSCSIGDAKAKTAKIREQFLNNLAYLQYNSEEFQNGRAFDYILDRIENG